MEYQIEMLRKHLGEKVKGVFYGSSIEVRDPVSRAVEKKPLKPFLVGQTTLLLERGQLRIPHKSTSEIIQRQMTNFQVIRISERTQEPTYTNEDEHGLDAMIFALYAFMNEYPELMNTIDTKEPARKVAISNTKKADPLNQMIKDRLNDRGGTSTNSLATSTKKVGLNFAKRSRSSPSLGWGRRGSTSGKRPIKRRTF